MPALEQPPLRHNLPASAAVPAASRPAAPELRLWQLATQRARLSANLLPGLAEVVEKVGPCAIHGDLAVTFTTAIQPDRRGQPMARMVESAGRHQETAFAPLVRHAHALLDTVENAVETADPLAAPDGATVRRAMERIVDGRRCIGYQSARRTAGLDLEFSLWIDAQLGHALRVDFRGINLRDAASDNRIASVYGMRRYEVDTAGRWVLRCQTDRITFVTADPALPATGYAERNSTYSEHWEHLRAIPSPAPAHAAALAR